MTDIKPCPFCGKKPDYWEDTHYQDRHVITCGWCGAEKRSEYGYDSVLRDWNTRYNGAGELVEE
uniref:Lar family restriction alleviation protein n=1 Tax=Escherichia coli TaxID=562 RepID=UPI003D487EB2